MIDNKILIIFLLFLIGISFFSLRTIKSEGSKCIADPIMYSLDILEKQANSSVTCSCSGGNYMSVFNKGGVVKINKSIIEQDINYTELGNMFKD